MATTLARLKSINAYPIPAAVIEEAALRWDVDLKQELSKETIQSKGYNLCKAELLEWLTTAPNVSQGGQSYSFSPDERKQFQREANCIRAKYCEETEANTRYGYKGSRL